MLSGSGWLPTQWLAAQRLWHDAQGVRMSALHVWRAALRLWMAARRVWLPAQRPWLAGQRLWRTALCSRTCLDFNRSVEEVLLPAGLQWPGGSC